MRIPFEGPLDLDATLYSGQAFRWRRREDGRHEGFIRNVPVCVRRSDGVLEIEAASSLDKAKLRHYFRLDPTHERFLREVGRDDLLEKAIAACSGLRLLRQDPWEVLVGFLLSQNSNEPRIRQNIETLAQRAGERVVFQGGVRYGFPTPAALAEVPLAALRRAGLGYRAAYVRSAASTVASGSLDPDALGRMPYDDALAALTSLEGVGPKVADCILLYGCGHLSAFPADVWIRRLVAEHYYHGPNKTAPYAWIRAFAIERFGPHAGYAQHLLFHWRRRLQTSAVVSI